MAELPVTGTDGLPSNVSLKAIVEKYQLNGHSSGPSCQEHQQQPLNMYCVQDRQLICGLCLTVGQHQGHSIDDLQAAYIREKQTPQLLAKLSEKKCLQVCEVGKQLELKKEQCEKDLLQDRQEVLQFFQKLETTLAKKKMAFLNALDKAGTEVAQAYDPLIYRVKEMQEEQLDLVTLFSAVEDEDTPLVFLDQVHVFKERVQEFIQTPVPSVMSLSMNTRAADLLHTHWRTVTLSRLDEAPVPKMSCTKFNSQPHCVPLVSRLFHNSRGVLFLGLFLTSLALWGYFIHCELLLFPLLSSISEQVDIMSTELITSCWSSAEVLVTQLQMSHLVKNGHQAFQQLFTFLQSIVSWFK